MGRRIGTRSAVIAAASFLALSLPATLAHADVAAPAKGCAAYEKTVTRHQVTVEALDVRFAAERRTSERLSDAHVDATAEADGIQFQLGDLNEELQNTDPSDPRYADLLKQRDAKQEELKQAEARERVAYEAWRAFEADPQLATDRTRAHALLKRAKTRLATCQSKLVSAAPAVSAQ
ncbi:hypothetical protein [Streptomyces sp. NPDC051684]|uniref:hypothetical protein n=1 Tax=Streptomyces sp. NPDC051684 TaxID=3365670 RepID=UPI0037B89B39